MIRASGSFQTFLYTLTLLVTVSSTSSAQLEATIFLDSTAQVIRGFGAANIVGWRPDMTESEMETAFGTADGQLGFSILRLRISPNQDDWVVNLPSATFAHERGVTIIASPWSPPAPMKTNNSTVGGELRDDMYDDYAAHLDAFNTYMEDNGVPVYGISVQNEPDAEVTYESCDWNPGQMLRFMRENAPAIGTRVIAPESLQFRRELSDPILNDSLATANLGILGGHLYGGGLERYPLAEERGKEIWMTEHLVLETDLAANLGTALDIQTSMRYGMSAYLWWYIVRFYGPISDDENPDYQKGDVTKRGYMMSQFSRFIRPGFVRVHTTLPRIQSGVSVTAYKDSTQLVIVAINTSGESRDFTLNLDDGNAGPFSRYVTDETRNVAEEEPVDVSEGSLTVTLGPQSVTTFVSDYRPVSNEGGGVPDRSFHLLQNHPNPFQSSTTIGYVLVRPAEVTLEVFDLLGRKVSTIASGRMTAGRHEAAFDASRLSPGIYLYALRTNDVVETRMMVLTD